MPPTWTLKAPCARSWSELEGEGPSRGCSTCQRQVLDLSQMTEAQVERVLEFYRPCAAILRLPDGRPAFRPTRAGVLLAMSLLGTSCPPGPAVEEAEPVLPDLGLITMGYIDWPNTCPSLGQLGPRDTRGRAPRLSRSRPKPAPTAGHHRGRDAGAPDRHLLHLVNRYHQY